MNPAFLSAAKATLFTHHFIRMKNIRLYTLLFLCTVWACSFENASGETQETLKPQDVPIAVPFEGNSFITSSTPSDFIDPYTGAFTGDWKDKSVVSSSYFYVGSAGILNVALAASNDNGNALIKARINGGKPVVIKVKKGGETLYTLGRIRLDAPGYVKVDLQGISMDKTAKSFAKVSGFRIGGPATKSDNNHFVTPKAKTDENSIYFIRRGASVHWKYIMPTTDDIEYFYNEVVVDKAENSSYYMLNGFGQGYMGIQQLEDGSHIVIFSVWGDDNDVNGTRPTIVKKGSEAYFVNFDDEGSGRSCRMKFDWKEGKTYKALVKVTPNGDNSTTYSAFFFNGTEWKRMASLRRPKISVHYTGAYSFLENFDPGNSIHDRSVLFKNQWVRTVSGEWKEVTDATFSCDVCGRQMWRYDYSGALDDTNHGFILRSFGFTNNHTAYGTPFSRHATGIQPQIDLEALEKL